MRKIEQEKYQNLVLMTVKLPVAIKERLEEISSKENVTVSNLLREALAGHFDIFPEKKDMLRCYKRRKPKGRSLGTM